MTRPLSVITTIFVAVITTQMVKTAALVPSFTGTYHIVKANVPNATSLGAFTTENKVIPSFGSDPISLYVDYVGKFKRVVFHYNETTRSGTKRKRRAEFIPPYALGGNRLDVFLPVPYLRSPNKKVISVDGFDKSGKLVANMEIIFDNFDVPAPAPIAPPNPSPLASPTYTTNPTTTIFINSDDLFVVSCSENTVVVQGSSSSLLNVNERIIKYDTQYTCNDCSVLFRTIVSIEDGPTSDTKILTTKMSTFNDIFDDDVFDLQKVGTIEVESIFNNCIFNNKAVVKTHVTSEKRSHANDGQRKLQTFPDMCLDWKVVKSDGRCQYTDCFVGINGDPANCFSCLEHCSNGCGGDGSVKFSGNFVLFDFGEPCCIHDHCYSTFYDQQTCDFEFLQDMISQCPILLPLPSRILGPLGFLALQSFCPLTALLFFGAVRIEGEKFYNAAQFAQKQYGTTPACIAKCPSTQESGGQGTTKLVIDLLEKSGTFPVTYEMYTIPDELTIIYEGNEIYATGGLVGGNKAVDVTYAGQSTIIEVIINAPLDGTAWDVYVGCPRQP